MIRTFVAIEIPTAVRQAIGLLQDDLRDFPVRVSWVRPGNIHLTLKFLGEIKETLVDSVSDALAQVGNSTSPFSFSVETLGFFPNARRPRVLWVGVHEPNGDLVRLADSVEQALTPLGFKKEKRGFSPHLTFGRVRDPRNVNQIVDKMKTMEFKPKTVQVREMIFMKSTLNPGGSIYEPIERFPFSAGESGGGAKSD